MDVWEDSFAEFSFEEFLRNQFIKFYVQIFRWSKDISDCYYVDFTLLKSNSDCLFMHHVNSLIKDIKTRVDLSFDLEVIDTLTVTEESLPNKG